MAVKCHFYFFAFFRKARLPFNYEAGVLAFINSIADHG